VLSELREYDLLVAGVGPYRDDLERAARETGVADHAESLGYLDDDALLEPYIGAAVSLALSLVGAYEPTVAETLASGTSCAVQEAGD